MYGNRHTRCVIRYDWHKRLFVGQSFVRLYIALVYTHSSGKGGYRFFEFSKGPRRNFVDFRLRRSPKENNKRVRIRMCGAHSISSFTPIKLLQSPNTVYKCSMVSFAVWGVASSWINTTKDNQWQWLCSWTKRSITEQYWTWLIVTVLPSSSNQ